MFLHVAQVPLHSMCFHKTMVRKSYSVSTKLAMVNTLERRIEENNDSLRAVAKDLGVDASQLRRWSQQRTKFEAMVSGTGGELRVRAASQTVHSGRQSCLNNIEEELLAFIFEHRENGLAVSIRMVTTKACQLDGDFRRKTARAKDQAIRRFVKSHNLVHRVHTHQSQENIADVQDRATDWIQQMRPILIGEHRQQRFIINMDQTPIFFSLLPRTTLELSGARTVNLRTSTSSTMRVTVAVTVAADGFMLTPLFVFKGKPGGRIEREFTEFDPRGIYCVQEKAWMDEAVMQMWVTRVLRPFVQTAPAGIEPVLFLDSYRCHMMATVVNAIEDMGVRVEHIPGGCTGLCQPIDVGIGKPLKNRVRNMWEDWMVSLGPETVRFAPPSRQHVANWVVAALQDDLPSDLIKRSWRHQPYSYFPTEQQDEQQQEEQEEQQQEEQQDNNGINIAQV
jgi:transposase-like protein